MTYAGKFSTATELGFEVLVKEYTHKHFPKVTLIPMIHLGDEEFYSEAFWIKSRHDIVLLEGAKAPFAPFMMTLYKLFEYLSPTRLVRQGSQKGSKKKNPPLNWSRPTPDAPWEISRPVNNEWNFSKPHSIRYIKADLGLAESKAALSSVSLWQWVKFFGFVIVGVFAAIFFIRRNTIIETLVEQQDDDGPEENAIWDYIVTARENYATQVLHTEITNPDNVKKTIAVEYGERHMARFEQELLKRGYKEVRKTFVLSIGKSKQTREENMYSGWLRAFFQYDHDRNDCAHAIKDFGHKAMDELKSLGVAFDKDRLETKLQQGFFRLTPSNVAVNYTGITPQAYAQPACLNSFRMR